MLTNPSAHRQRQCSEKWTRHFTQLGSIVILGVLRWRNCLVRALCSLAIQTGKPLGNKWWHNKYLNILALQSLIRGIPVLHILIYFDRPIFLDIFELKNTMWWVTLHVSGHILSMLLVYQIYCVPALSERPWSTSVASVTKLSLKSE